MGKIREFREFIEEYITFFTEIDELEKTQFNAVMSRDFKKTEECAIAMQSGLKKMQSMETRRMKLQSEAGFEGKTFSEIIACLPEDEKSYFIGAFERFNRLIGDVAFYNAKSQEQVKEDLRVTNGVEQAVTYDASPSHEVKFTSSSFNEKA